MKQNFTESTKVLQIINDNKKLTDDNYSESANDDLAKQIWDTIKSYVQQNLSVYQNWDKQDYDSRKTFVKDVFNLLLDKFDNHNQNKPKIYFQEEISKIWPKEIAQPAALCYSPDLSPWAKKYFDNISLDASKPFFAFFHDLSGNGMLGQITHEFTHYLQSIGKSSISYDVVKKAADYYQYYYADKNKYKQIYIDSIHEVEARKVGKYVHEQAVFMIQTHKKLMNQQIEK